MHAKIRCVYALLLHLRKLPSSIVASLNLASPTPTIRPPVTVLTWRRIIQNVSYAKRNDLRFPNERVANFPFRATELTVQSERAFQKQPHIFQNSKTRTKTSRPGKGGRRWYKDVGLGFRTPKTAIEGTYIGTCDLFSRWSLNGGTWDFMRRDMVEWTRSRLGEYLLMACDIVRWDSLLTNL